MKTLILAALLCALLALDTAQGWVAPGCEQGWTWSKTGCFIFVPKPMTWVDAQKNCRNQNADLGTVRDAKEYGVILEMIGQGTAAWLGSNDAQKEGCWSWIDGSTFTYANWAPGQPDNYEGNENCLHITAEGKQWNDTKCSKLLPSICVKRMW